MVDRKGLGYIIEVFVASLVVFVFVMSSYATISSDQNEWNSFRNQITGQDATYVMQRTGLVEKMLDSGDKELVAKLGSKMVSTSMTVSGTVKGPPTGYYNIGVFTKSSEIQEVSLKKVSSGDRCYDDLEEIKSDNIEFEILRSTPSSPLEDLYDTRVYISDSDSNIVGGLNGERDYDTIYIDRGKNCQFSVNEGPKNLDQIVEVDENRNEGYQFKEINSGEKNAILYKGNLPESLRELLSEYKGAKIEFELFNFSDDFVTNDMLIFTGNETLPNIYANRPVFLSYAESNPVLLNMNLDPNQLNSGIMNDIGFSYVNITQTNPPLKRPFYSNTRNSRRIKNYLNILGYSANDISLDPGSVSSEHNGHVKDNPVIGSSNFYYETSKWNVNNDSMVSSSEAELNSYDGLPETRCSDPHNRGKFAFYGPDGQKNLTGFATELSGSSGCQDIYGVSVDLNDNNVIETNEKTYLSGSDIEVLGKKYQVQIDSQDELSFVYIGPREVEYLNVKRKHNGNKFDKIGRLPKIDSSSSEAQRAMLGATILYMLQGETTFGPTSYKGEPVKTSIIGENGVYSLTTRWER